MNRQHSVGEVTDAMGCTSDEHVREPVHIKIMLSLSWTLFQRFEIRIPSLRDEPGVTWSKGVHGCKAAAARVPHVNDEAEPDGIPLSD